MNLTKIFIVLVFVFCVYACFTGCKLENEIFLPKEKIQFITNQIDRTLEISNDPSQIPRTIDKEGNLVIVNKYDWTSGFFAGNLWQLYKLTNDEKWKTEAVKWTEALDSVQYFTNHHDIGFMINCSYGNGLAVTGKKEYEKVMVQAAKSLITRYNPNVRCIESWDYRMAWDGKTEWFYPVIIDNMMNLELLFEATKLTGDSTFYNIAVQHAQTTMKNHYRKDFSCYHVVDYDTITGEVLDKATCQGFTDESSWARGQAWGLYGFTLCYRYTNNKQYLEFAENIANYILTHPSLPEDIIPYWDFNVKDTGLVPEWNYVPSEYPVIPRDVSAASIISSALFELSGYSEKHKNVFLSAASKILDSLLSPSYLATTGNNKYFILNHSVGSIPHGVEIDVPLVYADYYFLEAVIRKMNMSF